MNFSFKVDKQKNILEVDIKYNVRKLGREAKKLAGVRTVKQIIDKNFKLPEGVLLGKCLNPHVSVDNLTENTCHAVFLFDLLVEKTEKPKTPRATTQRKKRKTTKRTK